ncbi:SAVED domain-containing protein [Actinokineospora sp.]|uniref:SAVED domain-containing protein n=1 Tax=Actinokineospora sp. TaxID=1872133 RepID=UPI0040384872
MPLGSPELTLVRGAAPAAKTGSLSATATDGTLVIVLGTALGTAFGPETIKTFLTTNQDGRWGFATCFLIGVGLVLAGFLRRRTVTRNRSVAIVVTARDTGREPARGADLHDQAEAYCGQFSITLRATTTLDSSDRAQQVDELGELVMRAIHMARVLTPDAMRIHIVPTMRLTAAFRFGAYLGNANPTAVVHQGDGAGAYFPAVTLRPTPKYRPMLTVHDAEPFPDGDADKMAIAVDLQGRGPDFMEPVRQECRNRRIGNVVLLSLDDATIPRDPDTFAAIVEQITDVSRSSGAAGTTRGDRFIMLSGPVAISIGLGARLAAQQRTSWTPLSYNADATRYESL